MEKRSRTVDIDALADKVLKLFFRIKNTSSVRFHASRRVRVDYQIAQLTVVFLSLWAILFSYILASRLADERGLDVSILTAAGVVLPVFIVVFSLIENGEAFLRSHQLEYNARQLRELSDQLYAASAIKHIGHEDLLAVFNRYSQQYSDILERSPANHDEIDYFHRLYRQSLKKEGLTARRRGLIGLAIARVWIQTNFRRTLYIAFWFAPALFLTISARDARIGAADGAASKPAITGR